MEINILDASLRRDEVVDVFESLIWTERFQKEGDFQLQVNSTPSNKALFKSGTMMALTESKRIMVAETFEDTISQDGEKSLQVTGRSIEKVLYDRIARGAMTSLTTESKWNLNGTPGAIMRKIFHDICVTGTLSVADKIPFIYEGTILPASTISESTTVVDIPLEPMTVGDALVQIGEQYDLGFRMLRNDDLSQIYFDVYAGSDRTTGQSSLPAVIFSPDLGNLQDTKALVSDAVYKNCAYVFSPVGFKVVWLDGVDPSSTGFEKRILVVTADDITDSATADAAMTQRGLAELSKNRQISAFDGEITQYSDYKYGVDYQLGDLIELRNIDGSTNKMRVTEQIFVSDKEGDRSYPTLSVNQFITPGSWLSWDSNQKWIDLDSNTTAVWANQV
jgi:hypothetical protein